MPDRSRDESTTDSPFTVTLPSGDAVGAMAYPAAGAPPIGTTMILAHGAGAPQTHPFMTAFARLLSARGIDVVTFNFLYMERGRRVPDPKARLEACYRAVIAAVRARAAEGDRRPARPSSTDGPAGRPTNPAGVSAVPQRRLLVIGGKSMGGRIATQVAAGHGADGGDDGVDGLVLLGYPLHPPGRPDKPRTAHLPSVAAPMLFVQGERDVFGTPDELRPVVATCADAELVTVAGGDHSLKMRGKNAARAEEIFETVTEQIVRWLAKRATGSRRDGGP